MVPVLLHPQHVHMSAPATCSFDHAESFLFGMEVNQGLNVLLVSCQVIFISSIDDWLYFLFTAFVHSSSVAALSWSQSIKKQSIGKSTCQTVWENNMIPTCENLNDVTWKFTWCFTHGCTKTICFSPNNTPHLHFAFTAFSRCPYPVYIKSTPLHK